MLRTILPALTLLGSAWLAGCSAGNSDTTTSRGGSTSGASGGATSNAGHGGGGATSNAGQGGSGGTQMVGGGGIAGVSGSLGVGGTSNSAGSGGNLGTAGGAGSAGSAGTSSGAPPLFSDDFEGATIDTTKWTPHLISSSGVFELDSSQKHGGAKSLHLKHTGFSSMQAVEGGPVFPAPNNTYYARVGIRVASDMGTGKLPTGHVIWVETGDVTNDTHEVRVGANLGYFQSNLVPSDTDIRDPAAAMTTDAWHCIQFQYGNDLLDVKLDGVHSSISTTNWVAADSANGSTTPRSNWSPTYAAFRIGWELGSGEVWYDDVALDHVPVACN